MLICGVEEPLEPSAWHFVLDESTGSAARGRERHADLSRYTFVWTGRRAEAAVRLTRLLSLVQAELGWPAAPVSAWVDRAAGIDLTIRSKVLASRRRKQGWMVGESPGLAVALKAGEPLESISLDIRGADAPFEGIITALGHGLEPQVFLRPPARPSMEYLGGSGKLYPSEQFLEWLASSDLGILYPRPDERDYVALVLVSPRRLSITELRSSGIIDEATMGAGAALLPQRRARG